MSLSDKEVMKEKLRCFVSDHTLNNLVNLASAGLDFRIEDVSKALDLAGITDIFWERVGEHQVSAQGKSKSNCKFYIVKGVNQFNFQNVPEDHYYISGIIDREASGGGQHLGFYVNMKSGLVSGHLGTSLVPVGLLSDGQLKVLHSLTFD